MTGAKKDFQDNLLVCARQKKMNPKLDMGNTFIQAFHRNNWIADTDLVTNWNPAAVANELDIFFASKPALGSGGWGYSQYDRLLNTVIAFAQKSGLDELSGYMCMLRMLTY